MAKLTDKQIINAKSWLHDIFVSGGIISNPIRALDKSDYDFMYGTTYPTRLNEIVAMAKVLCNAIKLRKVTSQVFLDCDNAFHFFGNKYFVDSLESTRSWGDRTTKAAPILARYYSWFCASNGFYWDDTATSTYEKEEILKTVLGHALFADKCFVSQQVSTQKTTSTPAGGTKTATPKAASSGTPGQPQNPFKARGALSSVAVDLLSTPGQKEYLTAPVFCINGADSNGTVLEDTMYIRPVESDPKSQARYMSGNTNKVLFGKAKGYGYCQVYFTSLNEANEFMKKATSSGMKLGGGNVSIVQVCQLKNSLSNGYFNIGTEFGPAYISASKLNESLEESTEEIALETNQPSISKKEMWESFEDAYFHE